MKISKNFKLEEFTGTTAPYINVPNTREKLNIIMLVKHVLQPLRDLYGKEIHITSGYRCPIVNKHVGGAKTSQHTKGQAADITAGSKVENEILFSLLRENLSFDQLINEHDYTWLHVSYIDANRNEVLKYDGKKYTLVT